MSVARVWLIRFRFPFRFNPTRPERLLLAHGHYGCEANWLTVFGCEANWLTIK